MLSAASADPLLSTIDNGKWGTCCGIDVSLDVVPAIEVARLTRWQLLFETYRHDGGVQQVWLGRGALVSIRGRVWRVVHRRADRAKWSGGRIQPTWGSAAPVASASFSVTASWEQ